MAKTSFYEEELARANASAMAPGNTNGVYSAPNNATKQLASG